MPREIALAAVDLVGKNVINHENELHCADLGYQSACMEIGLGPHEFDCSGLVIRSISSLLDRRVSDWPSELRHVKQMHDAIGLRSTEDLNVGDVAVFGVPRPGSSRRFKNYPYHTGIVTGIYEDHFVIVHAKLEGLAGKVVPTSIARKSHRLMGILDLEKLGIK